jgi:hypothetical protein
MHMFGENSSYVIFEFYPSLPRNRISEIIWKQ